MNILKSVSLLIFLLLTSLYPPTVLFAQTDNVTAISSLEDHDTRDSMCAPRCIRRMFSGSCVQWGRDFCGPGEAIACIPFCTRRMFNGSCQEYGSDFCGNYPVCEPHCTRRAIGGRCVQWGNDACWSYWY